MKLTVESVISIVRNVITALLSRAFLQGLAEMFFDHQPHFSLVSNGAEVIMIEKKFFQDNASQRLMVQLREAVNSIHCFKIKSIIFAML